MEQRGMSERELLEALGQLPRSRQPRRDLWPSISARLDHPAHAGASRWRIPAMVAALVVAFLAGTQLERQESGPAEGPAAGAASLAMAAALAASEREYQAAFRSLVPMGLDGERLDARTVDGLEGSWRQLQQAEAALLAALREHPGNPFLAERLLGLRAQQLEFLKQLHSLDQTSRRNT